jgi:hypothetical protein
MLSAAGMRKDFLLRKRRKITAMAAPPAPTAATGMRRFRIGTTTNLNAFSDSSCLTTGAAGLAATGAAAGTPAEASVGASLVSDAGASSVAGSATSSVAVSAVIMASRFVANCWMSLPLTSGSRERPNWAGRPVTFSEVWIDTTVSAPVSPGLRVAATFAEAVPAPRVSLPLATIAIVRLSWSFSVNLAVPL